MLFLDKNKLEDSYRCGQTEALVGTTTTTDKCLSRGQHPEPKYEDDSKGI